MKRRKKREEETRRKALRREKIFSPTWNGHEEAFQFGEIWPIDVSTLSETNLEEM
jgi:hypothetical protein